MLTNYAMEGHVFLAPDGGGEPAPCPVNYGMGDGGSAPEAGNAGTQAETKGAVGTDGTQAANAKIYQNDKKAK